MNAPGLNTEDLMGLLHIGGMADGETIDLPGNVMKGRQSFKLTGDLAEDALRHHDSGKADEPACR